MRLRRVIWKDYGVESPAQIRERSAFIAWLRKSGATVQAWMLEWEVSW